MQVVIGATAGQSISKKGPMPPYTPPIRGRWPLARTWALSFIYKKMLRDPIWLGDSAAQSTRPNAGRICLVSKPRGSCAFCGGQTGLTKGHIWPDCFGRILPSDARYYEQKIGLFNTFESTIPGPEKWERVGTGPLQKRRPRNTCKTCNSGWMSRIETAADPHREATNSR
jgi:hypothetical protein